MYKIGVLIFSMLMISCGRQDPTEQLEHLSGYWEIHHVTMPDGTKKDFSINTTIDYIEIEGNMGVRTKLNPQFDGTFITTNTAEAFSIKIENDSLRLYYQTPFASWKETVIKAKDSLLEVLNHEGKRYTYHKFRKFK
ncbi:lipocalin-like domain-containing protein [Constantimarinum furrinae]|uniref:Lipocalin-like domain-containing protein n=1 Tax=Constantimarinum furrinae TaxID=2562285 RepID=A0A7G8PVM7_9FLAO|nr:lipocalin family protein [Constantimarinum furrinae]QNJ98393.1 hypothetical protein ALE3EI_1845 [Constantimarinum furrinae]